MVSSHPNSNKIEILFGNILLQTINAPHEQKQKDNIEYNEYRGDEVHDKIYRSILKQTYRMFRLFWGTFQSHIPAGEDYSVQPVELIDKLKKFYCEVSRSLIEFTLQEHRRT